MSRFRYRLLYKVRFVCVDISFLNKLVGLYNSESASYNAYIKGTMSHKADETTQATTVATTCGSTAELGLDEKFHHSHSSTVNGVLLVSGCSTARLVEQFGCFSHGKTDQLRLGVASAGLAGSRSTRSELLQYLVDGVNGA